MTNNLMLWAALLLLVGSAKASDDNKNAQEFDPPAPIHGVLTLHNGDQLRYAYHFDHNALRNCVRVGDSLIALTESGDLLRFDARTLKPTAQRLLPGRGTAIAKSNHGTVLVGMSDGRVAEVDPVDLRLRPLFVSDGAIEWLGSHMSSRNGRLKIVAVVSKRTNLPFVPGEMMESADKRLGAARRKHRVFVVVFAGGKQEHFDITPGKDSFEYTTYFLDGSARLWMGADAGEFGGRCAYMDLATGKIHMISAKSGPIRGFLRASDGRVLAYGGMSHLGLEYGFVARVDQRKLQRLRAFDDKSKREDQKGQTPSTPVEQNLPTGPVDLMSADTSGKGFWVVAAHTLYRTNVDFSEWAKIIDLGGRWFGGRNYSVGNTPTVNALIPTEGRDLLFATGRDGFTRVSGGIVQHFAVAGQLENGERDPVMDIWGTSLGTLFLTGGDYHVAWKPQRDGWHRLSFAPERPPKNLDAYWSSVEPLVEDTSGILAIVGDNWTPGECVLVERRLDGVVEKEAWGGGECSYAWSSDEAVFATSRREIVALAKDELKVWEGNHWRKVGSATRDSDIMRLVDRRGRQYIMLVTTQQADIFYDAALGDLLSLTHDPDGTLRLQPVEFHGRLKGPVAVLDAVPEDEGNVLLATTKGLFRFHGADSSLEELGSPESPGVLKSACRDAQGRFWAIGTKLHISSDGGKNWESLDVPMISEGHSRRLRPDPENPRGIILALDDQGVVFIGW
jgi:hypothetical protein